MLTHVEWVAGYLEEHGSITPMDAMRGHGCMRLADVVFRLRKRGMRIRTVPETRRNRHGGRSTYARYVLEGGGR